MRRRPPANTGKVRPPVFSYSFRFFIILNLFCAQPTTTVHTGEGSSHRKGAGETCRTASAQGWYARKRRAPWAQTTRKPRTTRSPVSAARERHQVDHLSQSYSLFAIRSTTTPVIAVRSSPCRLQLPLTVLHRYRVLNRPPGVNPTFSLSTSSTSRRFICL
jgi:hypothetical protein